MFQAQGLIERITAVAAGRMVKVVSSQGDPAQQGLNIFAPPGVASLAGGGLAVGHGQFGIIEQLFDQGGAVAMQGLAQAGFEPLQVTGGRTFQARLGDLEEGFGFLEARGLDIAFFLAWASSRGICWRVCSIVSRAYSSVSSRKR